MQFFKLIDADAAKAEHNRIRFGDLCKRNCFPPVDKLDGKVMKKDCAGTGAVLKDGKAI